MSIINKCEVNEFFKDGRQESFYDNLNLNKDSVVFVIGAYKGISIEKLDSKYGCQIYGFEPIKEFYNYSVKKFANKKNINLFNYGLGSEDKIIKLYINGDATSEFLKKGEPEDCKIIDFMKFLDLHPMRNIDLMEMNIEGGEFDLVPYLINNNIIPRIDWLFIQYHCRSQKNTDIINEYHLEFKKTHDLIYNYSFCWERWRRKH